MSFDLSLFQSDNVPAHIAARMQVAKVANNALSNGVSVGFPVLSIKGKVWHLQRDGERKLITLPNLPDVPTPVLEVVIVKANPHISKVYYPNGFTEGSDEKPACFSNDGIKPDASVQQPQCGQCATCPRNAWGSKITDNGTKGKECSDSRRIAVASRERLDDPILLRVPAGSLKELSAYGKVLGDRGVSYTDVVTRMSFDNNVAHQKLMFKPTAFLNPDEIAKVEAAANGDVAEAILGTSESELGEQPAPAAAPAQAEAPAPAEQAKPTRTRTAVKPAVSAPVETFVAPGAPEPTATHFAAAEPDVPSVKGAQLDDALASQFDNLLDGFDDL